MKILSLLAKCFCLLSLSISLINVYIYIYSTSVLGKNHAIEKYETVQLDIVSEYLDVFEMIIGHTN